MVAILTALGPYFAALLTLAWSLWMIRVKNIKVKQETKDELYASELEDRVKFRHDLLNQVHNQQLQLLECMSKCRTCEEDHIDTKSKLATQTARNEALASKLEDEIAKRKELEIEVKAVKDQLHQLLGHIHDSARSN